MKRARIAMLALTALIMAAPVAGAATDVSVRIGEHYQGDRLTFHHQPHVVVVPHTRVYRANYPDRDIYRYGDRWYYVEDGTWYEAHSWRGPFVAVTFSTVPHQIRVVPTHYRRHWGRSDEWDNNRSDQNDRDMNHHRGY